jgi:hypothetical protein
LVALVGAALWSAAAGASTTTTAPSAAQTLLNQTIAAARAEPGVHYVTSSSLGKRSFMVSGDAASHIGLQDITMRNGSQVGTIEIRLVHNTAYFEGDPSMLTTYLGMPSTLATKFAGRWISVAHTNQAFSEIADSVTMKAVLAQITLGGPITSAPGQSDGGPVVTLSGTSKALSSSGKKGPASLEVTATTPPLPILFNAQGTNNGQVATGSVTFSDWGEAVVVAAPAHATPNTAISSS